MAVKKFLPVLPSNITHFEGTVITGDLEMRSQTPEDIRELQLVYRQEQARQLCEGLREIGLNPDEIEYYGVDFEKNVCPSTGLESEAGILYNRRTGVSVPVLLDWVCEWTCTEFEWRGEYQPSLSRCKPVYFFNQLKHSDIESLK